MDQASVCVEIFPFTLHYRPYCHHLSRGGMIRVFLSLQEIPVDQASVCVEISPFLYHHPYSRYHYHLSRGGITPTEV